MLTFDTAATRNPDASTGTASGNSTASARPTRRYPIDVAASAVASGTDPRASTTERTSSATV